MPDVSLRATCTKRCYLVLLVNLRSADDSRGDRLDPGGYSMCRSSTDVKNGI